VAIKKDGLSNLTAKRNFNQPLDQILLSVIGVLQFFKNSGENSDEYEDGIYHDGSKSIEELRQEMKDYLKEFPDEAETAEDNFREQAEGHLEASDFFSEAAVFHDLGISSVVELDDGTIRAVLSPPRNRLEFVKKLGFAEEGDFFGEIFCFQEPVGPVRLGPYEWYFFTPNDEDDD
jgi:hypothetical protein